MLLLRCIRSAALAANEVLFYPLPYIIINVYEAYRLTQISMHT